MRSSRLLFLSLLAASATVSTAALPAPLLAPHRAVYDLALDRASDRSGITGLTGRMVYEFNGSPCDGYTVNFRFVTRIDTGETTRMTDQQTTTFEEAEGKSFSFVTKTFVDQALDREVRGTAFREPSGLKVELEKPKQETIELRATQFPTQHLIELIDNAEKGENFYETSLFDGSEDADKVMTTTVVIGQPESTAKDDPELQAVSALGNAKARPVDIAYFDETKTGGEELPEYRISFKMYDNGLTRDLVMDYGEFSMKGKLVNLLLFDKPKPCAPK